MKVRFICLVADLVLYRDVMSVKTTLKVSIQLRKVNQTISMVGGVYENLIF